MKREFHSEGALACETRERHDICWQRVIAVRSLSKLIGRFEESVIREMTRICTGAGGLNLAQGFPDFAPPEEVVLAAEKAMRDLGGSLNQYPVTFGEPALREAIAEKARVFNRIPCDPDLEVTVTCGATEAMMAVLMAVVNPGDEVIVFEPFYENYGPDAILSGATPRYVRLWPPQDTSRPRGGEAGDWHYDARELEAAFNSRTKAIIVNTPHNPAGKVFTRRKLEEIAGLCLKWDALAITDEVYEHITYDGAEHVSIGSLPEMRDRTITISSASKTYSVSGWRVGWAIAGKGITQAIRKVHDYLTVGAPTPFQYGVAAGLRLPDSYYSALASRYRKCRESLFETLSATGFEPLAPCGAYYIVAGTKLWMERLGTPDDYSFCKRLIEVSGVASVPGNSFISDKGRVTGFARFCYAKSETTLERVAAALRDIDLDS